MRFANDRMQRNWKIRRKVFLLCLPKKRVERACDKKNIAKDLIEETVTSAVRQYLLDDDVITWIADGYQAFLEDHRRDSALVSMQEELAEVEKGIKNIVTAIEQGIFTTSTRECLLELEGEKQSLQASIAVTEATLEDVPRERIEFWLRSFRDGDAKRKEYQAKLIDSFVQAVYLYDDSIRIVCNYTGKNGEIAISLSDTNAVVNGEMDVCSLTLSNESPRRSKGYFASAFFLFVGSNPLPWQ